MLYTSNNIKFNNITIFKNKVTYRKKKTGQPVYNTTFFAVEDFILDSFY